MLKEASLNNMMSSVFGREYDVVSGRSELSELVEEGYDLLGMVNWGDHLPFLADFDLQRIRLRCSRLVPRVNRFVGGIIAERRRSTRGGGGDFLDVMMSVPEGERLSDSDIIAVLWVRIY